MSYTTLTQANLATLKAYILADPVLGPKTSGPGTDFGAIALAMSATQAAFWVYKSSAVTGELGKVINYVAWAAMTAANQSQWINFMQMNPASYDPSRSDIQSFMSNTWSGALGGQGQATRDALVAFGKRNATRVEQVLADTSGGNGAQATPAALTYEGSMSLTDVSSLFL